jgi:hypothetical protein
MFVGINFTCLYRSAAVEKFSVVILLRFAIVDCGTVVLGINGLRLGFHSAGCIICGAFPSNTET